MAAGKFEINKDKAGKYRWHLKAANSEIIAASHHIRRRESSRQIGDTPDENMRAIRKVLGSLRRFRPDSSALR